MTKRILLITLGLLLAVSALIGIRSALAKPEAVSAKQAQPLHPTFALLDKDKENVLTLPAAPLLIGRKLRFSAVFIGFAVMVSLLVGTIFYWKTFPVCYVDGLGLTAFKKVSEYLISLILAASFLFLLSQRKRLDEGVLRLLASSILFSIVSELAFTFYVDVYDLSNLFGHVCKIAAYYLIYKAVIETGFIHPYNLLFMHLKQNQAELLLANEELESRVRERTADLDTAINYLATFHLIPLTSKLV